jgi:anti-sigma factor RsiW
MNHIDERALALLDSGDLDAQTAAEAEAHLRECLSCRALSRNFEASDQWLRSLGTEPDTNELAALAAGTLSRIAARRPRRGLWLKASGIAAALVLGALLFTLRHSSPVAEPAAIAQVSAPPATQATPAAPKIAKVDPGFKSVRAKARARPDRPRIESVSLVSQKDGPPILKMKTDDPNVVILWVMSGKAPQPEVRNE